MNLFRTRSALCLLALLLGLHSAAGAQTLTEATATLQELERRQQQLNAEQTRIQHQIGSQQAELQALEQRPSPERDELDSARAELDRARAAYAADPSDGNQAKLKNAEFKFHLAERKYAKANEEYSDLLDQLDASREALAENEDALARLTARIADQRAVVDRLREEQLARERAARAQKEQQLQAREQQMLQAQQEIERLKALLEEKERQAAPEPAAPQAADAAQEAAAAPAAATDTSPAAAAAAAPQANPESQPEPSPTASIARPDTTLQAPQPAPAAEPQPAPAQEPAAPAATAPATPTPDTAAPAVAQLTDQAAVLAELQRLEQATANSGRKKGFNRILHIKPASGDKVLVTLRPLGNEQFRGDTDELPTGPVELVIGLNKWQTTIEPALAGKTVVLVFDAAAATPRLVYYDRTLQQ